MLKIKHILCAIPLFCIGCASEKITPTTPQIEISTKDKWDLKDLCADDKTAIQSMNQLLKQAQAFKIKHQNLFKTTPKEADLKKALEEYEEFYEKVSKVFSYASLKHSVNLEDDATGKMYQSVVSLYTQINSELVFFQNEIIKLPNLSYKTKYDYWLKNLRLWKSHILDTKTEEYATQKSLTSDAAWVRLYDETLASIVFKFDGQELRLEEVLTKTLDPDETIRKKAILSLSEGLKGQEKVFVRIFNTVGQDSRIENSFRKFSTPDSSRHLSNQIEKEVVDLLVATVKENYKKLSHRYYKLKARILKKDRLEYWDRNAPLFDDKEERIPYEAAKVLVKEAYAEFSPKLAEIVQRFYDNEWIDVYPRKGKIGGAFCSLTVPSVHPYLLLNYQGKTNDLRTLAHELGHGIHTILAKDQGVLMFGTPLTIAETASVFGEMLAFEKTKKLNPKKMLASKIEDMLNTVVRQIAFHEFEIAVHSELKKGGELTLKELNAIFRRTQEEALGPHVNLDPAVDRLWIYVSHFVHEPFYVYAYAFGDCLVNSLYMQYKKTKDKKLFVEKYIEFLSAGGSKSYKDLLEPFDLDPTQKSFWENGLKLISDMIDELESLL
ncbi:MAG: M3 family oligoendopeptidase [Alphaproteobacteria bacterium]|nr:MAG: M3 family oligoendopeptidase [Alphaproteobacteria bacterium]